MTRSHAERDRRRTIAEAASGFPTRVRVALYGCVEDEAEGTEILVGLRRYATARDWDVAVDVVDIGPKSLQRDHRTQWPRVRELIEQHLLDGIVVPSESHLACDAVERSGLRTWIQHKGAFAEFPLGSTPDRAECEQEATR
ncbi:hypothetical protein ACIRLA_46355 [Streptomyces sp. NPDC102364]|uniref:hypothetical protein n=1 Tax=Streptomyces sp. NPDC102364 TaxID=3366161 RepID=UPI003803EDCC